MNGLKIKLNPPASTTRQCWNDLLFCPTGGPGVVIVDTQQVCLSSFSLSQPHVPHYTEIPLSFCFCAKYIFSGTHGWKPVTFFSHQTPPPAIFTFALVQWGSEVNSSVSLKFLKFSKQQYSCHFWEQKHWLGYDWGQGKSKFNSLPGGVYAL